jgi:hypothetical protein
MGATKSVRPYDAQLIWVNLTQSLTEALKAGERSRGDLSIEATLFVEAGAEAHTFAKTIDDRELPVDIPGDDHMKTVGTEIDGRQELGCSPTVRSAHVRP